MMEEAENKSSVEEVVSPTADVQQEEQLPVETSQVQEEDSEWIKNLRKDRKEALRRADEAEQRLKLHEEIMQRWMSQSNQQQSPQQQEPDIIQELAQEEYVPGTKVAKAFQKLNKDFDEKLKKIEQSYANRAQQEQINDLKREYADFDEVVNPETLAMIEQTNPKLARSMAMTNDPYAIGLQSYEYIKAKGFHQKFQQSRRSDETERKIEQNKSKVQSPQAFDKRPIATAFKLTDQMKKDLYDEMKSAAMQAGMGY